MRLHSAGWESEVVPRPDHLSISCVNHEGTAGNRYEPHVDHRLTDVVGGTRRGRSCVCDPYDDPARVRKAQICVNVPFGQTTPGHGGGGTDLIGSHEIHCCDENRTPCGVLA